MFWRHTANYSQIFLKKYLVVALLCTFTDFGYHFINNDMSISIGSVHIFSTFFVLEVAVVRGVRFLSLGSRCSAHIRPASGWSWCCTSPLFWAWWPLSAPPLLSLCLCRQSQSLAVCGQCSCLRQLLPWNAPIHLPRPPSVWRIVTPCIMSFILATP